MAGVLCFASHMFIALERKSPFGEVFRWDHSSLIQESGCAMRIPSTIERNS